MRHLLRMPVHIATACMRRLLALSICLFGLLLSAQLAYAACLSSEVEPNNTDTTANAGICAGVGVAGSLSSSSDYDWYKLVVTGPGTISISLSHATNVDFDWFLYAATGSYIAYASTSNNPEVGSKAVSAAGTYFVRVKSYSGSGAYTLTVNGPIAGGSGGLPAPTFGTFSVPAKSPAMRRLRSPRQAAIAAALSAIPAAIPPSPPYPEHRHNRRGGNIHDYRHTGSGCDACVWKRHRHTDRRQQRLAMYASERCGP